MIRPAGVLSDGLLGRSFDCECGRTHHVPTRAVVVEPGVIERAPGLLAELAELTRVLVVADRRTHEVAATRLGRALRAHHAVEVCVVPDDAAGEVHASVERVDQLAAVFPDRFDLYVAVGSGTINDLTKELAHRRLRPYAVLATAASMNGYTSSIVALLEGGLKTTGAATPPVAVLADPQVLCDAPVELTLAGLGDLVSKPYCGCDWWIASLVRGEPYCPTPGRILDEAFASGLPALGRLGERDPAAVELLFRLLVTSGITMTIAGTSSPASGGEHLLSHYWDMTGLRDGRPLRLHGAQVGVASLAMDALYAEVHEADFAAARFASNPSPGEAEFELGQALGSLVGVIGPQWMAKLAARSERDLELLVRHEGEIKSRISDVLETGCAVRRALEESGAPMAAADLGIPQAEMAAALRHARKIRSRYTVLDVAAELGLLDDFANAYAGDDRQ